MSDFYQGGVVSLIHRLGHRKIETLESELEHYSRERPVALVLPVTYSDLHAPACQNIFRELRKIRYVREFVVTLGMTNTREQFDEARKLVRQLPDNRVLIWCNGPRMRKLYKLLERYDLRVGGDGKGRSAWTAYGYVIAKGACWVIALHDCDIVNYNRELLARLCYPCTNPNLDYEFCKGFYSRISDRMHGRVTRLYVVPIVRSLIMIVGYLPFLEYLNSFRYPLAGEFSMVTDIARVNRVPGDWGLEVGTLAEVYRNCSLKRICQCDLTENYEHKHQPLSPDDPGKGLLKMSIDIGKVIFRTLASEGVIFSESFFRTLTSSYLRIAQETIKRYQDDAMVNGLKFDLHQELAAVDAFTRGMEMAGDAFLKDPLGLPQIPNWSRVTSAIPDFLAMLLEAIEADNE
ncbi:MAG: glycosyl transferase [Candidatus Abyssobacteria bacterium SURF_5]|uniref:Glycosyl transferase n=1 Tax=Abyssobacteria bacterium (strain SURF_5) TaxID=2093360 RepID=A0A3A4NKZ2_ABYX5|nr:MAG: glycosyl transferase [Candidatus Abyssubacteria bacterium SURF_5]